MVCITHIGGSSSKINITVSSPYLLNSLSVSAPNPSPISAGGFPSLEPSTGPKFTPGGNIRLNMGGAEQESGSLMPELTVHASPCFNHLLPDSMLLILLPEYKPDSKQQLNMFSCLWE